MAQVIQLAKHRGWRVAHFRPGLTRGGKWVTPVQADGKGFPDLLMTRREQMIVVETKVDGRRATPEQEAWLAAFAMAGVPAYLWCPEDWPVIEKILE
jgi:hypothetical protein